MPPWFSLNGRDTSLADNLVPRVNWSRVQHLTHRRDYWLTGGRVSLGDGSFFRFLRAPIRRQINASVRWLGPTMLSLAGKGLWVRLLDRVSASPISRSAFPFGAAERDTARIQECTSETAASGQTVPLESQQ